MSAKIARLLGNSKLASVAQPKKRFNVLDPKYVPTHQVIQTTSASLYRQDFGLKAALPTKINSRYLVLDDLDSFEGIPKFEPSSELYWIKKKFSELGVPVVHQKRFGNNDVSLFKSNFSNERNNDERFLELSDKNKLIKMSDILGIDATTPKNVIKGLLNDLKNVREDFKQYILKNYPNKLNSSSFNSSNLSLEALKFISQQLEKRKIKTDEMNTDKKFLNDAKNSSKIEAHGGLSYLQKGRLNNTIHGYTNAAVVPGRLVDEGNSYGVIGFVTRYPTEMAAHAGAAKAVAGKHYKQVHIPSAITEAVIKTDGSIVLNANGISKRLGIEDADLFRSSGKLQYERASKRIADVLRDL